MIIMDNASYHKFYNKSVPRSYKLRKQDCIDYLEENGVELEGKESALQLKVLVREFVT